jgi:hypothetical protein
MSQKVRIRLASAASTPKAQPVKQAPPASKSRYDPRGKIGSFLLLAWAWTRYLWYVDHKIARIIDSAAALLAIVAAGFFWWVGATFTFLSLKGLGLDITSWGYLRWIVPAGVSAIEMRWYPNSHDNFDEVKLSGFLFTVVVDAGSSMYGWIQWAGGRDFPIGPGFKMPTEGWIVVLSGLGVSLFTTLIPERLLVWSLKELKRIWTFQYSA